MARGELGSRVNIERADEVGVLATSFNTMAESLQTRMASEHEARAAAQELQRAESAGRQLLEQTVGSYLQFVRHRPGAGNLGRDPASHQPGRAGD